jgi:hypothetical protein
LERILTNVFLFTLLTLLTLDAWPSDWIGGRPVRIVQWKIDALLDVTGLWQGPWYLFAPDPPGQIVFVTATLWCYDE